MANGVRNFPSNCDSRQEFGGYCFCSLGFFEAYPGPWKYEVEVTDATPPNDVFNGKHLCEFVRVDEFGRCVYESVLDPGGQVVSIAKQGTLEPDNLGNTVVWDVGFDCSMCEPPTFYGGAVVGTYPKPADELPPLLIWPFPPFSPEPVRISPRAFDYELP